MNMNVLLQEPLDSRLRSRQLVSLTVLLLIGAGLSIVYVLNAVFLLKRIKRKASLILSLLSCIGFPLGTIIGAISLFLLSREEIKEEYA
jgi:hypothetical protein